MHYVKLIGADVPYKNYYKYAFTCIYHANIDLYSF